MERAARYAQAAALRELGYETREIAKAMGISVSYVRDLFNDPDGSKGLKRKNSYRGVCEQCGAATSGSNGRLKAPRFCVRCSPRRQLLYWSKSRIIGAIHEWAAVYGTPPIATDWLGRADAIELRKSRSVRRWPSTTVVQREFGSWANAIEAAGFPRPIVGRYRDESKRRIRNKVRWTKESIIQWMRDSAIDGEAPYRFSPGAPNCKAVARYGGWVELVKASGLEPRTRQRIVRSTS